MYENMGNLYRAKEFYTLEIEKFPESKAARYGLWNVKQREAGLLTEGADENGNPHGSSKTLDSLKVNIVPLERLRPGDF